MTPAFDHYNLIRSMKREDEAFVRTTEEVRNTYSSKDESAFIPAGAIIAVEFGHENGLYGRYSVEGAAWTAKCQVSAEDFHHLEIFAPTPA